MGVLYSCTRAGGAITVGTDIISLKAVNVSFGLREYCFSGHGTASASNEISLARNTGGTITTNMLPLNTQGPSTSITKFGVDQATTVTTVLYRFGVNANGALFRWVAAPGMMVECSATEQCGWEPIAGSSSLSGSAIIEQF